MTKQEMAARLLEDQMANALLGVQCVQMNSNDIGKWATTAVDKAYQALELEDTEENGTESVFETTKSMLITEVKNSL